jgi:hypothetical protein
MNNTQQFWYVVKQLDGSCQVVGFDTQQAKTPESEQWGAFDSEQEAIAKKIGLIRAGKCKPQ